MSERELSSYATDEVAAATSEYMGEYESKRADVKAAADAVRSIISLDGQTRAFAIKALGCFVCRECGSDTREGQCYCMADD